jgi:hypothetical protein
MWEDVEAIRLLSNRVPVVAFVNNHYAGYSPETVRLLVALMDAATPTQVSGSVRGATEARLPLTAPALPPGSLRTSPAT